MKTVRIGNKDYRIKEGERVVIINDVPKYVVGTAEEIIACIQQYTHDMGYTRFRVTGVDQTTEEQMGIMRLTIKKDQGPGDSRALTPTVPQK